MSEVRRSGGSTSASSIGSASPGIGGISKPVRAGEVAGAFAKTLEAAGTNAVIGQLEAILAEIDRQTNNLQKQKTFHALKKYKDLVQKFMKTVTDNMYVIKGIEGTDSGGRQKVLKTVQAVESSLGDLTSRVLGAERENVDILALMDDIRGMLVDLKG